MNDMLILRCVRLFNSIDVCFLGNMQISMIWARATMVKCYTLDFHYELCIFYFRSIVFVDQTFVWIRFVMYSNMSEPLMNALITQYLLTFTRL
jgi:hypothetical protein